MLNNNKKFNFIETTCKNYNWRDRSKTYPGVKKSNRKLAVKTGKLEIRNFFILVCENGKITIHVNRHFLYEPVASVYSFAVVLHCLYSPFTHNY